MNRTIRTLTLSSLFIATAALSGCAGGLANADMNMGDIDGIVKAPMQPGESPAYAKGDAAALAKRTAR